jgi:uncharacterized membrane protein
MKRFALNLMLGVALAAICSVASADTTSGSSGSLTSAVLCTLGFSGYCISPDTTRDPTIINN